MGDRLRAVWDVEDLDGTQQRFRTLLGRETSDAGRAEILTQLARVQGVRANFEEAEGLVDEAAALAGSGVAARARVELERGRIRRSSGNPSQALPLFESAFEIALTGGEEALAADAAHMAALEAPDRPGRLAWTERGLDLARDSRDPDVSYWIGPLLNNLGWEYYAAGEYEVALDAFQRALHARVGRPAQRSRDRDREVCGRQDAARTRSGRGGRGAARAGGRVDARRRTARRLVSRRARPRVCGRWP